jgi:hypothetical protein
MLQPLIRNAALSLSLGLAGCSTAEKVEILEARLRSQEDMLTAYESEVGRIKRDLSVARTEAEDLRLQLAGDQKQIPADQTHSLARVSGIEFSSLMTGGWDMDGQPGHDGLTIVLIPHDHDGELVKIPGTIEIEAFDLSSPGGARRIGRWTFDQRDIHEYWHKGVIQSGYQFELPWQTPPDNDQVLVHAHFRTAGDRKFDTTLTVKVDPPRRDSQPPTVSGVQHASAEDVNPFVVRQAGAEQTAQEDANQKTARARGTGFTSPAAPADREGFSGPAAPVGRQLPWGHLPLDNEGGASSGKLAVPLEVPPPIEDWWSDDDRAAFDQPGDSGDAEGVQTSDWFTDERIRRFR